MATEKIISTLSATKKWLAGMDPSTSTSVLAAQALQLAMLVDEAAPGDSIKASAELRQVMAALTAQAKPKEVDGVDELRERRRARGAGAPRSDRSRVRKQPS